MAFATILAVVAGLTITASASFAHDIYASVIKKGQVSADAEVKVARRAAVVIGVFAIVGGILAKDQNIAFLVALAFAVAASANLPTILYSLFWKSFTTRGALWSIYGGLISSITLIIFSPVVSGKPIRGRGEEPLDAAGRGLPLVPAGQPGSDLHPVGLLPGLAGQRHRPEESDAVKFAEMEVRSLTGAGAEKATVAH